MSVVVSCLKIILSKCVGYAIICAAVIGMYTQYTRIGIIDFIVPSVICDSEG